MIQLRAPHRQATQDDDLALAELINMAGEGLPFYLWSEMVEAGGDPWQLGRERARRDSGGFSYRNAIVREEEGRVVAVLIGYSLPDTIEGADHAGMPPLFVPMQELEDQAPGTWYVNVLATYPDHRGRGYGRELLEIAERIAAHEKKKGMSIIVSNVNEGARRLYERQGFEEKARRPIVKERWHHAGEEWVLLTKALSA